MVSLIYLLLLLAILTGVAGQLLLKSGMARQPDFQLVQVLALTRNPAVIGGFVCYGVSVLLYFRVLGKLDLSLAYPSVSLGYVMVTVFSRVFFGEQISRTRWLAVVLICAGVIVVGLA
jgi:multidrug transporter EmrE-like cation transporter